MISTPSTATSSTLSRVLKQHQEAAKQVAGFAEILENTRSRQLALDEVSTAVKALAIKVQHQCQARISLIVTRCLETIFGDSKYTFVLVFEEKRGQTEARCVLQDAEGNEYDPIASTGGGVMDVVTFGLRLACLMLQKPEAERVLIMDEPMKFLSKEYRAPMLGLLEALATESGIQFIMVTHFEEYLKGNVIEI